MTHFRSRNHDLGQKSLKMSSWVLTISSTRRTFRLDSQYLRNWPRGTPPCRIKAAALFPSALTCLTNLYKGYVFLLAVIDMDNIMESRENIPCNLLTYLSFEDFSYCILYLPSIS